MIHASQSQKQANAVHHEAWHLILAMMEECIMCMWVYWKDLEI